MNKQMDTEQSFNGEDYFQADIAIGKERKRTIRVLAASISGSSQILNEDTYGIATADDALILGIFDGTSNLKLIAALGNQSGAYYASDFLKDNLQITAQREMDPRSLILRLNERLLESSQRLEGVTLTDVNTLPASTGTIVKIDTDRNKLSFAHVGDSFAVVYYDDGHSAILTDNRNHAFDRKMFAVIAKVAKEKGITPREALHSETVRLAYLDIMSKTNNPNGQGTGVINGDSSMEPYVQSDSIPLKGITAVLLGTDGLIPQGWSNRNEEDRQRLLTAIQTGGPQKIFSIKRKSEDEDPDWNHIRHKHSDDATLLLVSFD